jgi:ABC-type lipoprotein export system ATPase subunit
VRRRERFDLARHLLTRSGLDSTIGARRARELSGGEQQRVAIARALAGKPEALLADEPTSNLDAETASILLNIFSDLRTQGTTLMIASHDPRVIEMATDVVELEAGRLKS